MAAKWREERGPSSSGQGWCGHEVILSLCFLGVLAMECLRESGNGELYWEKGLGLNSKANLSGEGEIGAGCSPKRSSVIFL